VKDLNLAQVSIIGLGLMGGSLAGALHDHCRIIVGVARRQETIDVAVKRGLVDHAALDLSAGVREADAVILATPVRTILSLIDRIGPLLKPDCLLMDLGSTKSPIVERMALLPEHVQPLGGHPLCGREVSGIDAADPRLYRGKPFVLTPLSRTSVDAMAMGVALVEAVGANPMLLDAQRHDHLLALVSHLPYLVSCALVATARKSALADPLVWATAASGFRDTSRLASSNVTMMTDILLTNRQDVLAALDAYGAQLSVLKRLLVDGDERGLRSLLTALCDERDSAYRQPS
jgi:prephenate dehydrogenase